MSFKSELILQAKLVRRACRRLVQMVSYRRPGLRGAPVLFANSFPKSGTHLLTQVMEGFPDIGPAVNSGLPAVVTYDGITGRRRTTAEVLGDLHRLHPGDIGYGHVYAWPEVVEYLCHSGMATYFILRDPRDAVISHVYYVTELEPRHFHHHYYNNVLHDFDQRLRTSIRGLPDEALFFPNIYKRFEPFLGWLERPEVLVLKYEDFILDQSGTVSHVLDHAIQRGFFLTCDRQQAVTKLAAHIDPQNSPTFRSGKVGGWRSRFTQENKRIFKAVCGDLLVRLGYEQNDGW